MHADVDVVADFKMQMRRIHSAIAADRADLLATLHLLAHLDHDLIQMSVEGVAKFHLATRRIAVGMADDHDVAPATADIVGEGDDALADVVHRIAKVGITATPAVPILAEMLRRAQPESARLVVAGGIRLADGEIKAIGEIHLGRIGIGHKPAEGEQGTSRQSKFPFHAAGRHSPTFHRAGEGSQAQKSGMAL